MLGYIKKISSSNQTLKTVGIYTFSNFLVKGMSFASLPLFTYVLTKKDFGVIGIFGSSISLLMPFISLSIIYSTSTDYFKLDNRKFANLISSTSLLPLIMTLLAAIIFYLFFPFFSNTLGFDPIFIWLLPLVCYCNFLFEQSLVLIRNENKPKTFLWLNMVKVFTDIGLALVLIFGLHYKWQGRIYGIFFSFFICAVFAGYYLQKKKYLFGKIDFSIIRKELMFSLPAIATQFSIFCQSASDRYFVNYYYGEERTGVYSMASTFASVMLLFSTALLYYFSPKIYSELSKSDSREVIKRMFWRYFKLICLGLILLMLFTPLAYYFLISKIFLEGLPYFFLLAFGNAIWSITYFFYSFLFYQKAKKKILLVSMAAILISLLGNNFMIRAYGEIGASIACTCIYAAVFCIVLLFTRKFILVPAEANSQKTN